MPRKLQITHADAVARPTLSSTSSDAMRPYLTTTWSKPASTSAMASSMAAHTASSSTSCASSRSKRMASSSWYRSAITSSPLSKVGLTRLTNLPEDGREMLQQLARSHHNPQPQQTASERSGILAATVTSAIASSCTTEQQWLTRQCCSICRA
jgi:hypothetical protein